MEIAERDILKLINNGLAKSMSYDVYNELMNDLVIHEKQQERIRMKIWSITPNSMHKEPKG